ncbi:nucleoside hydrolase [Limosilactobacillus panis]|uniref:Nucleoside hydrolase n=1 Tax=Limosilactobacillus panis TaxID=47493 RepID=A0ABT7VN47_9LACO|nr:nucleoside hydrolase [Limosilactobacillus panis]MDM8334154.1 nucleoside hydrolase [Limosilactobacillus panis]HJA22575.1 nucleoside hydrolase [Candidatus Limosilactobacillus intestinipullorum]
MSEKVILDCDCTFDLPGCDVDDGLTIIYLLGSTNIDLLGVTLDHGNSDWAGVLAATRRLKEHLCLPFNYYFAPDTGEEPDEAARDFLVRMVNTYPHEITLLGTGGLTNIKRAVATDPLFLNKVKRVVLMGGNCFPLVINGHEVGELNFSIDPAATQLILASSVPLVIMNGHMTTEALFSQHFNQQLTTHLQEQLPTDQYRYFTTAINEWIAVQQRDLGLDGFCNWDITTAVYLEQPELFTAERVFLAANQPALASVGRLQLVDYSSRLVTMPAHIKDPLAFNNLIYRRLLAGLQGNKGAQ